MKKSKLEIEYSYDFELFGLRSSAKGHKLAWEVNHHLNLHLVKQPDLIIQLKNEINCSYAYYAHQTAVNQLRLFKNKPHETDLQKKCLVPEHPHFDFIIMTQGEEHIQGNRLQEDLRKITIIELVAFIPLDTLKMKEHFIF